MLDLKTFFRNENEINGKCYFSEMQCCDEVTVESFGGILECHPYVLGDYRRIGQCGGRSFYQHKNNSDIFIYFVCGAWYVGLQVGKVL